MKTAVHPMSYSIDSRPDTDSVAAMTAFVAAPGFPCVGARSAFNKERVRFGRYGALADARDSAVLCTDLQAFSAEFPDPGREPVSYVAMFTPCAGSETDFSERLWSTLQLMHAQDHGAFPWDPSVDGDPDEQNFSFSIAGRAFFVVGLHPQASRIARRAPMPCIVFNFHDQFEAMRASGQYAGMQKVIRNRDLALQGSLNPMLSSFGEQSEARQYSGQAVDADWKCPFHHMKALSVDTASR